MIPFGMGTPGKLKTPCEQMAYIVLPMKATSATPLTMPSATLDSNETSAAGLSYISSMTIIETPTSYFDCASPAITAATFSSI